MEDYSLTLKYLSVYRTPSMDRSVNVICAAMFIAVTAPQTGCLGWGRWVWVLMGVHLQNQGAEASLDGRLVSAPFQILRSLPSSAHVNAKGANGNVLVLVKRKEKKRKQNHVAQFLLPGILSEERGRIYAYFSNSYPVTRARRPGTSCLYAIASL